MAFEIRAIGPDEVDDLILADRRTFGGSAPPAEEPRTWAEAETDRTRVAFEDGAIVGLSRAYSFDLSLPGGAMVPAAAVSWVGVLPSHRRRGVLTKMMQALHEDARSRGEPAAILTASESVIYGRFGYGIATWRHGLTIERTRATFAQPFDDTGRVRMVEREEAEKVFPVVYDEARRLRAGGVSRPDYWWPQVYWFDRSRADNSYFAAIHEDASGNADGFVDYEIKGDWVAGHAERRVMAYDIQSTNDAARVALWRYLLGIDLVNTVTATNVSVDEPIRHLLGDGRRVHTDYVIDGLWLAPLDPAALLAARTYSFFDGHLVLEVVAPDGVTTRFVVDGNEHEAQCAETDASPDLTMPSGVLGSTLLGGNRFSDYRRAGLVTEHRAGALAYADAMFLTSPPPAMMSGF